MTFVAHSCLCYYQASEEELLLDRLRTLPRLRKLRRLGATKRASKMVVCEVVEVGGWFGYAGKRMGAIKATLTGKGRGNLTAITIYIQDGSIYSSQFS